MSDVAIDRCPYCEGTGESGTGGKCLTCLGCAEVCLYCRLSLLECDCLGGSRLTPIKPEE